MEPQLEGLGTPNLSHGDQEDGSGVGGFGAWGRDKA